jgi:peptidoglycan-associated lipoprotein
VRQEESNLATRTGCSGSDANDTHPSTTTAPGASACSARSADGRGALPEQDAAQLNAEKPLTDAFFGLDSTELNDAARTALQKNVEWMKRWATTKVMVEGHADSRGTNEYNLALGERRADAVRDYIVSLGLANDRLTIVSKGEEQPFCSDENEACWQQNRRGHFTITAK